jgi:hypothetical protein
MDYIVIVSHGLSVFRGRVKDTAGRRESLDGGLGSTHRTQAHVATPMSKWIGASLGRRIPAAVTPLPVIRPLGARPGSRGGNAYSPGKLAENVHADGAGPQRSPPVAEVCGFPNKRLCECFLKPALWLLW